MTLLIFLLEQFQNMKIVPCPGLLQNFVNQLSSQRRHLHCTAKHKASKFAHNNIIKWSDVFSTQQRSFETFRCFMSSSLTTPRKSDPKLKKLYFNFVVFLLANGKPCILQENTNKYNNNLKITCLTRSICSCFELFLKITQRSKLCQQLVKLVNYILPKQGYHVIRR